MLRTIAGINQNGKIELTELPQEVSDRPRVLVTFLEPGKIDPAKHCQLIDKLETIAGIQQGFEELNAGLTRPMVDFLQEMQQKYDMSEMLGKMQQHGNSTGTLHICQYTCRGVSAAAAQQLAFRRQVMT